MSGKKPIPPENQVEHKLFKAVKDFRHKDFNGGNRELSEISSIIERNTFNGFEGIALLRSISTVIENPFTEEDEARLDKLNENRIALTKLLK